MSRSHTAVNTSLSPSSPRHVISVVFVGLLIVVAGALATGCGAPSGRSASAATPAAAVEVRTFTTSTAQVTRAIRVSGSLIADEEAEVAAETAGRIVETPVELGTRVAAGAPLVRISAEQASAQVAEAEANAAQVSAALNLTPGKPFDPDNTPDVIAAKAEHELAVSEYERFKSLLAERVVSQSEYDQRATRVESTKRRYEATRDGMNQRFRQWQSAIARVALARKALGDTVVRAPFAGMVSDRKVSVGDFVTTGTRVVTVVRISPLRVSLTVPEQLVSRVAAGQKVDLRVDAYPDRTFTGTVRYVSPALRAEQRALTVEAIVSNELGELKPGLFASAEIFQAQTDEALLLDRNAIQTTSGTARVFVVRGEKVEEHVVRTGQVVGEQVEIVEGLAPGDIVAVPRTGTLTDGTRIAVTGAAQAAPASR
jgi:RND family efflux transporter MFP subunit